jgi:hypothetical protein
MCSGESLSDLFDQPTTTSDDDDDDEHPSEPAMPTAFMTPESLKIGCPNHASEEFGVSDVAANNEQLLLREHLQTITRAQSSHRLLQLPANHWRLIDVYFAYTHSWLPLISKERILKLCYSYPSDGVSLAVGCESADHAELWSILALADVQNRAVQNEGSIAGYNVIEMAEFLTYNLLEDADIGHVGALLNISLLHIALQNLKLAWTLLGRAIRIGTWLKQGLDSQPSSTVQSQERLHGLMLGCFVVETVLSAQLRAVPSLRPDHVSTFGHLAEEGLDEWQPWSGCDGFQTNNHSIRPTTPSQARSTFNQLVKLCFVLNDRVRQSLLSVQHETQSASLSTWLTTLPATLGPVHSLSPEQTSPQKLHLFLAFLVVRTYDVAPRGTVEEAMTVLEHFTYALGTASMPPLLACFLHIFMHAASDDGLQENRLAGILSRFSSVWRTLGVDQNTMSAIQSVPNLIPVGNLGEDQSTPRPMTGMLPTPGASDKLPHAASFQLPQATSIPLHNSEILQPQPMDGFEDVGLERAESHGNILVRSDSLSNQSMDLDTLFEHFTSAEGNDQFGGLHPQFMQNLGFAPDSNLADLMANDYGWVLDPG